MTKKIKVLNITAIRADWGLMKPVVKSIHEHPDLEIEVGIVGTHLMELRGNSYTEVEADAKEIGFPTHIMNAKYEGNTPADIAAFTAACMVETNKLIAKVNPDFMTILGDRHDAGAVTMAAFHNQIPIAHLRCGEVSSTNDEPTRHAMSMMSHILLCATPGSKERLIRMGIDEWRIHHVGDPGLDAIVGADLFDKDYIFNELGLDPSQKTVVATQHVVTSEMDETTYNITQTLEALDQSGLQIAMIYPNADAGGQKIIDAMKKYEDKSNFHMFANVQHKQFLSLMKYCDVMVGNSSSGISEAASFYLPVVNIGTRQEGREQSGNVINVGYDSTEIYRAIVQATSAEYIEKMKQVVNVYGDGKTGPKVANIIAGLDLDNPDFRKKLLEKHLTY